ncbi:VOC family protein [Streptomyces sp. NBC_00353]|uniref:VOC family protein n=1 Tax=Streptomyces sp. NBC_00353 TaxID=2975722 RepID=UPI002E276591
MLAVWHFSFTVSDLDAAVAFYVDALGCTCVHRQEQSNEYTRKLVAYPDAHLRIAQLRIGEGVQVSGHHLELVQYLAPRGERGDRNIANPGAAHLAFAVADIEAEYARLSALGVRFFSTPNLITDGVNKGGGTVYFYGPDDIVHELVQPPHRTTPLP